MPKLRGRIRTICQRMNRGKYPIGSRQALTPKQERDRIQDREDRLNLKFERTKKIYVRMQIQRQQARVRRLSTLLGGPSHASNQE